MPKPALLLVIVSLLMVGLVVRSLNTRSGSEVLAAQTSQEAQIDELEQQAVYWQNIINSSPTYRDGYIQLAVIYYQLNQDEVAQYWLNRTFDVDPNYELPSTLSFLIPLLLPR